MKLVDGVDRDGTDLITRLLLRLINTCSCGGEKKLHHQRRRNWRRNEGTKVMAKACWCRGRNGLEKGMPGWGLVLGALSLSFLSEGNGNEWAVGKSEMRKSGKVFGYG
ncbi:hypothetical protein H0E87_027934 [Populus deltoides]|uniref:Uncharacterized protein n=1 Tax=Populus deltoides TaxID=3696 RepID=A0A8T2WRE2_POPDE|nr:hypothetical protein H0E87_027934 [Populus deltoides]